ncbi:MAG: energy-coupling factor ABC transporter ATP-binding protein [Clostridiales Family XIII bacterium]|jgi:cobalt/nickel transport system ATP-binding protein|nr:energy-coupling factor ABC transporter ATP-binding protein [Clostridiales Family XIII bacterium]
MIDLNGISYYYQGTDESLSRQALDDINLTINSGESVSLLGANGSGKSTLLKLLSGLIFAEEGSYAFDGEAITKKGLSVPAFSKRFHQRVGFVFQNSDTQLFCADVYDEIAFGPRQMNLGEEAVKERVSGIMETMELDGFEHRQPYHLSGGEKRKVAIACVLAMNPEVLMLDEPLNGLDPRTQRWLAELLVRLNEAGKTIIVSTHDLVFVHEISKRAVLFGEDHRIVADRVTDELLGDMALLKEVNLVDKYYHHHPGEGHNHFHDHRY